MEEKAKVVLVMADGREVKARVEWDDLKKLTKWARIRVKAEPFGYYEEGVLESFYFQQEAIIVEKED